MVYVPFTHHTKKSQKNRYEIKISKNNRLPINKNKRHIYHIKDEYVLYKVKKELVLYVLWSPSKVKYSYTSRMTTAILSNATQDMEMDLTEEFTTALRGVTGM